MCEQSLKLQQKKFLKHSFRLLFSTVTDYGASLVAQIVKNLLVNARDTGLIPGVARSSGIGNGTPFQYSCLKSSMGRGAWWATVHGVATSWAQLSYWANTHTHTHTHLWQIIVSKSDNSVSCSTHPSATWSWPFLIKKRCLYLQSLNADKPWDCFHQQNGPEVTWGCSKCRTSLAWFLSHLTFWKPTPM